MAGGTEDNDCVFGVPCRSVSRTCTCFAGGREGGSSAGMKKNGPRTLVFFSRLRSWITDELFCFVETLMQFLLDKGAVTE